MTSRHSNLARWIHTEPTRAQGTLTIIIMALSVTKIDIRVVQVQVIAIPKSLRNSRIFYSFHRSKLERIHNRYFDI